MFRKLSGFRIGMRTAKTAVAVIVAMLVVDAYGATTSKLIFAMLGAMAAVQPTFKESLEACVSQIVGVMFGAAMGVLLMRLPIPALLAAGIGIVLVISLYNTFQIRFSPGLPCLIVVTLCTTEGIAPASYALGRIWDSAIGLGIGFIINTLIFPYDNSRRIRFLAESLDRVVIGFLEETFDGDEVFPDTEAMVEQINQLAMQLTVFSNQKLVLNLRRQKQELETFRLCEGKARELLARMEVLCRMEQPGRLDAENRRRLEACGAIIRDSRPLDAMLERDVVTNYHVRQILRLRRELLDTLKK